MTSKVKIAVGVGIFSIVYCFPYNIFFDGEVPQLPDSYWGPGDAKSSKEDTKIHPFVIKVDDKVLQSLKSKLSEEFNSQCLAEPLEGIGFQYGFNTKYLQKILKYWQSDYDWRTREKLLNKYPQFKTKISGIDIHFQHVKPTGGNSKYKETKPLLILLHGWPRSFVELQKIIPLLTEPENSDFNFELIIPSLPGYGFSEGTVRPGLGPIGMAQIFMKLMKRLGHQKFHVQGYDSDSLIAPSMAAMFPSNVESLHLTLCASHHPLAFPRWIFSILCPFFFFGSAKTVRLPKATHSLPFPNKETGYLRIQATKPDTIGMALSNSPNGLATYILEKFSTWTNSAGVDAPDGLLEESAFSMDELLDNIMIYWVTGSITTSMRSFSESFSTREYSFRMDRVPVKVPTACVQTPDPPVFQTTYIMKDKYSNLVRHTLALKGNHFLAMEEPKIFADDVIQFVKELKK